MDRLGINFNQIKLSESSETNELDSNCNQNEMSHLFLSIKWQILGEKSWNKTLNCCFLVIEVFDAC